MVLYKRLDVSIGFSCQRYYNVLTVGTRCLAVDLVDDYQMEKGEVIYKVPVEGNLPSLYCF